MHGQPHISFLVSFCLCVCLVRWVVSWSDVCHDNLWTKMPASPLLSCPPRSPCAPEGLQSACPPLRPSSRQSPDRSAAECPATRRQRSRHKWPPVHAAAPGWLQGQHWGIRTPSPHTLPLGATSWTACRHKDTDSITTASSPAMVAAESCGHQPSSLASPRILRVACGVVPPLCCLDT